MSFLSIPINEKSLSFIKNNFQAQIQALEQFYPIIKNALNLGLILVVLSLEEAQL